MGLLKEKELDNGFTLNYHRVVSVNSITNEKTVIGVGSYASKKSREQEIERKKIIINVDDYKKMSEEEKDELMKHTDYCIQMTFYEMEYDKNITVENAYEYLKTLSDFEDSEDI